MDALDSAMRELLLSQPLLVGIPAIKFFEPNKRFVEFMRQRYERRNPVIYDVGAGVGHVSKTLARAGLRLVPIDINMRAKTETQVLIGNGVDFPYDKASVVMICRPCHGPTVEHYIQNAIKRAVADVLYVGKTCNAEDDLGRYYERFSSVLTRVGQERESIYLMQVSSL